MEVFQLEPKKIFDSASSGLESFCSLKTEIKLIFYPHKT